MVIYSMDYDAHAERQADDRCVDRNMDGRPNNVSTYRRTYVHPESLQTLFQLQDTASKTVRFIRSPYVCMLKTRKHLIYICLC